MLSILFLSSALAATTATSSKKDAPARLAVDGQLKTAWMEDASGQGAGESFTLTLNSTTELKTRALWPGNLSNGSRSHRQYARPKVIRIEVDGTVIGEPIRLLDQVRRFDVDVNTKGRRIKFLLMKSLKVWCMKILP